MSKVVKGERGPSCFRAAIHLTLGCVLLSGCSTGSDRFTSTSFGSGYGGQDSASAAKVPSQKVAANNPQPAQPVNYQPQQKSGYQLASASSSQPDGYLQVSRVDLAPLPERPATQGTKTADGYGRYNQPPIPDGTYSGPRASSQYDEPRGDGPPPSAYDDGASRDFARGETQVYEPKPDNGYGGEPPYNGERGPSYGGAQDRDSYNAPRQPRDRGEGERVRVEPGDTLYALARRYGVTVDMIARANNLSTVYVRPGTIIYIPRADPAAYERPTSHTPAGQATPCGAARCYAVKPGDTLASVARAYNLPARAIAEANNLTNGQLKAGQSLIIPGGGQQPRQAIASAQDRLAPSQGQGLVTPVPGAEAHGGKNTNLGAAPTPVPLQPAPEVKTAELTPLAEPTCEATLANPQPRMGSTFRKPVEGKTIAQFGPQKDGTVNEGVTISVPKGTPVKAAENGVVAYVGDELPGFGNLILIRHADDFVTAYAHADSVLVKKCDVVKRGQTVATAGTTGDASQPQLHFEIRKNSKPVDPSPLLGS